MTTEEEEKSPGMTVGELKAKIQDCPDDMIIVLDVILKNKPDGVCMFVDDAEVDDQEDDEKALFLTGYES